MRVMRARAEVKAEYEAKIKEVKSKQWVRDKTEYNYQIYNDYIPY